MNIQRVISSVYFENVMDDKLIEKIDSALLPLDKTANFKEIRLKYIKKKYMDRPTIEESQYVKENDNEVTYILHNLFFDKIYGNNLNRLYKNNVNTIFFFPVYKGIDSKLRIKLSLNTIYDEMIKDVTSKEFDRDVSANKTGTGNLVMRIPVFSDTDESVEEYTSNLTSYFDRAFDFINEQKPIKIGEIVQPSLYGKFEKIIYSVDKEGDFFSGYYKKKLSSDKAKILNQLVQSFVDKFGRGSTSKDPFLTLNKDDSLRKYKADGKKVGTDNLSHFYALLETFIDAYKKTNDIEYLKSAVSSDNQTILRIFYRINNTDFIDEFNKIKVGSNYVYKITKYPRKNEKGKRIIDENECRIGYFREKRGLTNQFIFREYEGLKKKYCESGTKHETEEDKEDFEDIIDEEDTEETKDRIYKDGTIEVEYRNKRIFYRESDKAGSDEIDGEIVKLFDLHIYEKYKWFQFSDLGSVLSSETKIKFYNNLLFDRASFIDFLKKKGTYQDVTSLPIEFLRINQDNKLLLEYADYLLVFKKKTHVFKKTIFGIQYKSFIQRTKKAIVDLIFQTNEFIYMTKQKSKIVKKNNNKNYKIIRYNYYSPDDRHFDKELYVDQERKYCKKGNCELTDILKSPSPPSNTEFAIVIVDATRDTLLDVSALKQKTYCKQSRKNLLRYIQPILYALAPRFGGKYKTRKRLRSRRRKYRH